MTDSSKVDTPQDHANRIAACLRTLKQAHNAMLHAARGVEQHPALQRTATEFNGSGARTVRDD